MTGTPVAADAAGAYPQGAPAALRREGGAGEDVDHKQGPRAVHLFAGAGGGVLGGLLLGWRTVCAVEISRFCREVLVARQNDGSIEPFPIWDDVCSFDGRPWRGCCDIVCGGFPCQDISPMGSKSGIRGIKSSLWGEFARIVGESSPEWVFAENSCELVHLGLDFVLRDLAAGGYDAEWECLPASELGAPHIRDRIWILARRRERPDGPPGGGGAAEARGGGYPPGEGVQVPSHPDVLGREERVPGGAAPAEVHPPELQAEDAPGRGFLCRWWAGEPGVRRVADGVANGVDRLKSLGNGQVAYVAARAFSDLRARFG